MALVLILVGLIVPAAGQTASPQPDLLEIIESILDAPIPDEPPTTSTSPDDVLRETVDKAKLEESRAGKPDSDSHDHIGSRDFFPLRIIRGTTLSGVVQYDVADGGLRAANPGDLFPVSNGIGQSPVDTKAFFRRIRLEVDVPITKRIGARFTMPFESGLSSAEVIDAYIHVKLPGDLRLIAGQHKTRWGYEGLRGGWNINTIERSDATRALYGFRDSGLLLSGGSSEKKVLFDVGMVLGQGKGSEELNSNKDVLARFEFHPNENWALSTSAHWGVFNTGEVLSTALDIPVRRYNVGARYYDSPWTLETELMWSNGYNASSLADTRALGGYATGIREISEKLDFVVSYDRFDPDLDRRDSAANEQVNERSRFLVGLNYYLDRAAYHRIMLNYELHKEHEGPDISNNGYRLRYQYRF